MPSDRDSTLTVADFEYRGPLIPRLVWPYYMTEYSFPKQYSRFFCDFRIYLLPNSLNSISFDIAAEVCYNYFVTVLISSEEAPHGQLLSRHRRKRQAKAPPRHGNPGGSLSACLHSCRQGWQRKNDACRADRRCACLQGQVHAALRRMRQAAKKFSADFRRMCWSSAKRKTKKSFLSA